MPRFRFVAVDSEGMFRDGTIDAPDGQRARDRLAANGLKVRELEEVEPSPGDPPPFTPPSVIPTSAQGPFDENASSASQRPAARSRSSKGTVFFAVAAIVLTLFSVGYSFSRNPPWGRLSKYDFSTPEAALRSGLKMQTNADVFAQVEFQSAINRKMLKTRIDTLEVKRTVDFDGKKILFIQFQELNPTTKKTEDRKIVRFFEKDEDTNFWKETFIPTTDLETKDPKLAKEIRDWRVRPND